jgi:hypothetical protein
MKHISLSTRKKKKTRQNPAKTAIFECCAYQPRVGSSIASRVSGRRGQSSQARLTWGRRLVQGTFSVSQGVFGFGIENIRSSRFANCANIIAAPSAQRRMFMSVPAARDVNGGLLLVHQASGDVACVCCVRQITAKPFISARSRLCIQHKGPCVYIYHLR